MAQTLLEMIQAAMNEIGISQPNAIVGQVDDQSRMLLALANREGKEFSGLANSRGGWQALHEEYTFETVADQNAYDLPSDFSHFVQRTGWDTRMLWQLVGPITAQEKNLLRYGTVATGPRTKFYVKENQVYIVPTPSSSGDIIAYDYYSKSWCKNSSGVDQSKWQADTDTYKLDEECFIMGIKWRFLRAKGLDYAQEKLDYDTECMSVMARDGGNRDLPLTKPRLNGLSCANVPDSGFGGETDVIVSGAFSDGFSEGFN